MNFRAFPPVRGYNHRDSPFMNVPRRKIDLAKRERVMQRSQALGHCICDVRRGCPCDLLLHHDVCPCAGERREPAPIRLTELASNAGCASKIAPGDIEAVLSRLPAVGDPAVISGLAAADDAAIYRISDQLCLVQTVDVFAPCVDDPRQFGRICAANCLSDIYAMGGEPRTALSILGFPSESLAGEIMFQMLAGAMEKFAEAGVSLIGGHSIKEEEIKLGFAITGTIDPAVAQALDAPKAGDVLVLTKPLGTGVLTFCHQIGRDQAAGFAAATQAMAALNRPAAEAMRAAGATGCTDITGFGLFGHLYRMVRPAQVSALIYAEDLPAFAGAVDALRQGVIPGAIERNREFAGAAIEADDDVDEAWIHLGFDAQTSGGLLIAIPEARLDRLRRELAARGVETWVIGKLIAGSEFRIYAVSGHSPVGSSAFGRSAARSDDPKAELQTGQPPDRLKVELPTALPPATQSIALMNSSDNSCCCPGGPAASTVAETQQTFGAFMRAVQAGGALDEKAKELILFSLVVYSRCAPCFDAHYARAQKLGLTQAQLDEAAWCAIALGGAPVKMFYQANLNKRSPPGS